MVAAVLGNEVNFRIGRAIGPRAFSGKFRWLKQEYLVRTQAFYEKHGGKTIMLSRFIPIIRTFAPFVAGVGQMQRRALRRLQRRRRFRLGDDVHLGRLPVRQRAHHQRELRRS